MADSLRPLSREIAYLALTLVFDAGRLVSLASLAKDWGWSRGKVQRYLADLGVVIAYPDSTKKSQNQRGQIVVTDKASSARWADHEQIKLYDLKGLGGDGSRSRADKKINEQIASRSGTDNEQVKTNDINEFCEVVSRSQADDEQRVSTQPYHTHTQTHITTTTDDEISEYCQLGMRFGGSGGAPPKNPEGWSRSVRSRLERDGLSAGDRQQVAGWREREARIAAHNTQKMQQQSELAALHADPVVTAKGLKEIRAIQARLNDGATK
nr:hypothetical protein [uncultured Desulfuromonas sp.]